MTRFGCVIGIDEAGRGPIAGPVAVGAVCILQTAAKEMRALTLQAGDSKTMSQEERERQYGDINLASARGLLSHGVSMVGPHRVDALGISRAVKIALTVAIRKVSCSFDADDCSVLLDGLLRAPAEYIHQRTIIGGDAQEPVIGLASVVAKVTRDRYMMRADKRYPGYGFAHHKGYGTREHYRAIAKLGLSPLHRVSFLRRLT